MDCNDFVTHGTVSGEREVTEFCAKFDEFCEKSSVSSLWCRNNRPQGTHWVFFPELGEGKKTHASPKWTSPILWLSFASFRWSEGSEGSTKRFPPISIHFGGLFHSCNLTDTFRTDSKLCQWLGRGQRSLVQAEKSDVRLQGKRDCNDTMLR